MCIGQSDLSGRDCDSAYTKHACKPTAKHKNDEQVLILIID